MDKTIPAGAAVILDFIYRTETGKDAPECYEVIFGNRQSKLAKRLTKMTIAEVQAQQAVWSTKAWAVKFGSTKASSAAGAPQIMRDTLKELISELKLKPTQIYNGDLQDRLAFHLLKRRGYEAFMEGSMSVTEFGRRLAMEWASFPVLKDTKGAFRQVKRGQSYYAGDGLNKSLTKPETVEAVLNKAKAAEAERQGAVVVEKPVMADPEEMETPPSKSKTVLTWLGAGIMSAISAVGSFLGALDWRVQMLFSVAIIAFAAYGIKRRVDLYNSTKELLKELK